MNVIRPLVETLAPPNQPAPLGGREPSTVTGLLEAACLAPSGVNGQTWRFIIVNEPARRARVAGALPSLAAERTSTLVLLCGVPGRTSRGDLGVPFSAIDVSNALVNLILAATAGGVPCAWTLDVDEDALRTELAIPADVRVHAAVAL